MGLKAKWVLIPVAEVWWAAAAEDKTLVQDFWLEGRSGWREFKEDEKEVSTEDEEAKRSGLNDSRITSAIEETSHTQSEKRGKFWCIQLGIWCIWIFLLHQLKTEVTTIERSLSLSPSLFLLQEYEWNIGVYICVNQIGRSSYQVWYCNFLGVFSLVSCFLWLTNLLRPCLGVNLK